MRFTTGFPATQIAEAAEFHSAGYGSYGCTNEDHHSALRGGPHLKLPPLAFGKIGPRQDAGAGMQADSTTLPVISKQHMPGSGTV